MIRSAWDDTTTAQAVERLTELGVSDGDGCPLIGAPFQHEDKGLRCLFDRGPLGWLAVVKRWPGGSEELKPAIAGEPTAGGQLYRQTGGGGDTRLLLFTETARAALSVVHGAERAALAGMRSAEAVWSSADTAQMNGG